MSRLKGRIAVAHEILSSITASIGISACTITPKAFTGKATAGGAATITLAVNAVMGTALEGFFDGWLIEITSGTGKDQARRVTGYVGSTLVATVPAWVTTPDNTSVYKITPPHAEGLEAQTALIKVETAAVNFSLGSVVPTVAAGTNLGINLDPGESLFIDDVQNIRNFKCINRVASSGAVVKVITFA